MKIPVFNRQSDLKIHSRSVKAVVKTILDFEKCFTDEVIVHFVSVEEISRLHEEFFNDPSPTDCISFPIDSSAGAGYRILGEIFISPKAAFDYLFPDISKKNIYLEITLYLVHGLLHLLGFDDLNASERKKMRAKEKEMMHFLAEKEILLS